MDKIMILGWFQWFLMMISLWIIQESAGSWGLVGSMAKELQKEEHLPIGQKQSRADAQDAQLMLVFADQTMHIIFVVQMPVYIYMYV